MGLCPLTDDELEDIYLGALEILERTGIWVEDTEPLDIFSDFGCKVDRDAHRVWMAPEIVEEAVRMSPSRIKFCGRDPSHDLIWEPGRSTYTNFCEGIQTIDLETGELRESTKKDVGDIAHITEFLPELDFATVSVGARDVPVNTSCIHNMDAILRNTTKGVLLQVLSRHEADTVIEMAATVAGGRDELAERPIMSLVGSPVSPLAFSKLCTDYVIPSARANIPTWVVSMGLVGATMPVTVAGSVVLGLAEELAGLVLIQGTERGCPALVGQATAGFDMRTGLASVGCPEMAVIMAATAQIGRRIGVPSWAAGL
jgi:trimethylamine--corrinoid protein Co-methyltransferase